MAVIIDGKQLAKKIRGELKEECDELKLQGIHSKLAVIMVGDNPASKVYVRNKSKACNEIGIDYEEYLLSDDTTQEELISIIQKLNQDETVNGILFLLFISDNDKLLMSRIATLPDKDSFDSSKSFCL